MTEISAYKPGTFCWVDLATTNAEAARGFYTELLGVTATDLPAGEAGAYTMLSRNGKDVCALFQMDPEMQQQGMPSVWQSYVSVSNIEEAVARAEELGGTIRMTPFDVMEYGRMAVIADPGGAVFSLWEPRSHIGSRLVHEPGAPCWNELLTREPLAAETFYTALFGWTARRDAGVATDTYWQFHDGERGAAGMLEIKADMGDMPPCWIVYFAVADLDKTLESLERLGGTQMMPAMTLEEVGRFTYVVDPQGATFGVIQLAGGPCD